MLRASRNAGPADEGGAFSVGGAASAASLRRIVVIGAVAHETPHDPARFHPQVEARRADRARDRAVAAAYGWPEDIATDDALHRLLALNLERANA